MGGCAIVGGQRHSAAGMGMAISYTQQDRIVLCFLGDGALNEGEFHEAMNMAAIWRLPVLFFCENNLYGMGTPVEEVFAKRDIFRVAEAYDMPSQQVDGMDVLAVREATQTAVDLVRAGQGPYFIEALTYRFRGHSIADPAEYRSRAEEQRWQREDPITSYKEWLMANDFASQGDMEAVDQAVEREVDEAVRFADESPAPPPEALFENVYASS